MGYNNEEEITGHKADISNQCVKAINKIMEVTAGAMTEAGEKVSLLAGCSIPPLAGLAVLLGDQTDIAAKHKPTVDDVIFGACYVIASVDDHKDGVIMGFTPETVDIAMNIFGVVMNRPYTNIAPTLQHIIDRQKNKVGHSVPDHLKKFIPN